MLTQFYGISPIVLIAQVVQLITDYENRAENTQ